jgi:hypothetical protein
MQLKKIDGLYYIAVTLLLCLSIMSVWNFYLTPYISSSLQMEFLLFLTVKTGVIWAALFALKEGYCRKKLLLGINNISNSKYGNVASH